MPEAPEPTLFDPDDLHDPGEVDHVDEVASSSVATSDSSAAKPESSPGTAEDNPAETAERAGNSAQRAERTTVYTDGACSGNPGPGGWAWVVPGGSWASGAEDPSTNQRMEVQAVLHALQHLDGPLDIVSDSTYVVNCFRDEWWKGWERRGWKNSQKKPVANQDLWRPLIDEYKRRDVTFRWVKGHSGDEWNDIADELAVDAIVAGGSNGAVRDR